MPQAFGAAGALLDRLGLALGQTASPSFDLARSNPVKMLFTKGFALQTSVADYSTPRTPLRESGKIA